MKALALFSGGLDSMLAIKLITNQGIKVHALHFDIGFSDDEDLLKTLQNRAEQAGASFELVNITNKYLQDVLFTPKYGYGKAFNPCIDCHGYMFKTAILMLDKFSANFVISGEVVGQRPMSQRNEAMKQVKNLAGDENDLILRPLCAKLLPQTKPQREGWVNTQLLESISGRSRARQLFLAKEFGFSQWASPGGGCPYTDANFSARIKDFLKNEGKIHPMNEFDLKSLRYGRHLRLFNGAKLIIGRNENENSKLLELFNNDLYKNFYKVEMENFIGAFVLISKNANYDEMEFASRLKVTYGKSDLNENYIVKIADKIFNIRAFDDKNVAQQYFI